MKTIGIKLADGSFYPVLEDNTPSEKKLELTTAHNNQTKVMVDLYRSATCSMEDAEYVDSLQIENLNARPNGEPEIKFTVSLDEDNQLSAKIVDSETGNESNTTITLVSRTLEERLVTDEYDINDSQEADNKGSAAGAALAGGLAAGGLLAAAAALRNKELAEKVDDEPAAEDDSEVPAENEVVEPETTEEPEAVIDQELEVQTIEEEAPVEDETFVEEPALDDFDIDDLSTTSNEEAVENSETVEDSPESEALPDMDFDLPDDTVVEDSSEESEALPDMDFNLPDDTDNTADDTVVDTAEASEDVEISDDFAESEDFASDDTSLPDMNFDLPDDTEVVEATEASETSDETVIDDESISSDETISNELDDMDFDIPDDTADEPVMPADFFNTDDLDSSDSQEDDMTDPMIDTETPVAGGLNFDGLYDEETERGTPAKNDEDDVKKKTKVPVIICIVCAIICIIATLLILFIIPSKYNLITKKHVKETIVAEAPAPEPSPAPVIEAEPEPAVPEAKEDEVIIIEKAEEVVPSQPPVAEEKPKAITYKIKWGDTLWDIADTYYKNPWRYKYIARYNGIRNPDYIISGTIITIPAQ